MSEQQSEQPSIEPKKRKIKNPISEADYENNRAYDREKYHIYKIKNAQNKKDGIKQPIKVKNPIKIIKNPSTPADRENNRAYINQWYKNTSNEYKKGHSYKANEYKKRRSLNNSETKKQKVNMPLDTFITQIPKHDQETTTSRDIIDPDWFIGSKFDPDNVNGYGYKRKRTRKKRSRKKLTR